jgi:regulation of enolase protein 1 (concanavalin A-like superfamily)/gas vesicle protein
MLKDIIEVATKLIEFVDRFEQSGSKKRESIAKYFSRVSESLKEVVRQLKNGDLPHSEVSELRDLAEGLPSAIEEEIGEENATELSELLKKSVGENLENLKNNEEATRLILEAAGKFDGLAFRVGYAGSKTPSRKPIVVALTLLFLVGITTWLMNPSNWNWLVNRTNPGQTSSPSSSPNPSLSTSPSVISNFSPVPFSSSNNSQKLNSSFGWQPGGSEANSYQLLSQNTLSLTAGAKTDQWQGTDSAPLILYRAKGNFDVRVKVEITPKKNFQLAGIGVRSTSEHNTFVRTSRHKLGDQNSVGVGANRQDSGLPVGVPALGNANYAKSQVYLRIVRQESSFDLYYSENSTNWVILTHNFVIEMPDEVEIYLFVISVDKQEGIKATFSNLEIGSM